MAKKARVTTINISEWTIATVFFLLLTGCTTIHQIPLTAEGKFVRQILPEMISPCEFLGVVEEEGERGGGYPEGRLWREVLNKVRNTVAEMSGNSYVLLNQNTPIYNYHVITQVDAYRCP